MIFKKFDNKIFLLPVFLLVTFGHVFAASDNFNINLQVGDDTIPPSVPAITSAIPVATSQIDVTWSSSIDNVSLSGYVLFRDSVAIATTTLTSFSDSLLLENTTYTYTVTAFDSSGNTSAQSLGVATTTLTNVVVSTSTSTTSPASSGAEATSLVRLQYFNVTPANNYAILEWTTFGVSNYVVSWGKTSSYEIGSLSSSIFSQKHYTTLTQLEPDTKYWYKVTAVNPRGVSKVLKEDYFITTGGEVSNNLGNVSFFFAEPKESSVQLSWVNNFSDSDDEYVRIVRSNLFYPSDVQAGSVVYEGRGSSFFDRDALVGVSGQYYTIFVRDKDGNVSSGAVAFAKNNITDTAVPDFGTSTEEVGQPTVVPDTGEGSILRAVQVEINQKKYKNNLASKIILEVGEDYTVSVPVNAVTKNLKTIIVSVQDPSDQRKVSAYLLKLNKEGTFYTAVVTAANTVGDARLTVELFDYSKQSVRRISALITFRESPGTIKGWPLLTAKYQWLWLVSGLGFIMFLLLLLKLRTEDKP